MKVLNLRCANGHGFEGWFSSEQDYMDQNGSARIECPVCSDQVISRLPSAPRLNLSGAREGPPATAGAQATAPDAPADLQATWLRAVRELMERTVDVGPRFAEEARRIHYGEVPQRGIRGQATLDERAELHDEGIETLAIPIPQSLKGALQ